MKNNKRVGVSGWGLDSVFLLDPWEDKAGLAVWKEKSLEENPS